MGYNLSLCSLCSNRPRFGQWVNPPPHPHRFLCPLDMSCHYSSPSLFFSTAKCFRFIHYFSFPSSGVSHFFQGALVPLDGEWLRNQDGSLFLSKSRPSQQTKLGNTHNHIHMSRSILIYFKKKTLCTWIPPISVQHHSVHFSFSFHICNFLLQYAIQLPYIYF